VKIPSLYRPWAAARSASLAAGLLAWLLASGVAWAQPRAGVASLQAQPAEPLPDAAPAWIERLQRAAASQSYEGTMVFSAGAVVASSRVAQYVVGGQAYEQVQALDGRAERSYRHNGTVVSFWPDRKVVTLGQRDDALSNPLRTVSQERLRAYYELRLLGPDLVAGRRAQVLLLAPRDELRFAQRLWIDLASGLMLRADVLDARGEMLESSAFSEIDIGVRPQAESVRSAMRQTAGWQRMSLPSVPTQLESEGWQFAALPAGFRLLGCVRKAMALPPPTPGDARTAATAAADTRPLAPPQTQTQTSPQTLHAVLSDGLTRVSLFIEDQPPGRPVASLVTRMGATHTVVQGVGERWRVVLMGDVPVTTLKRFAAALERRP
jgi:sigma-E factor negative regulatory protein RseB